MGSDQSLSPETDFSNAFVYACHTGELSRVQELLASGRVTAEDLDRGLGAATRQAQAEIVATLFDAGASVSDWAMGALHGMSKQDLPVIRLFLDHGLDPNAMHSNGELILRYILAVPVTVLVLRLILDHSSMLDPTCARELLSRGADPNRVGVRGVSHLTGAIVASEDTSLVELLLEYGAKLEQDLLFDALRPRGRQPQLMTSFLLDKGLDPNQFNADWGTPLHFAVRTGKPNIVKLLLDAGADPTARSAGKRYHGEPPSAAAQHQQNPEIKEQLLDLLRSKQLQDT
ncbi:beta-lactamase-like protein [Penicillium atrosanguineum]|uniref:beta-lactamase-like protein n=1 Tax=Penicillium atrosanguineum TaxID=1132637 RepID=UPI00239820C4|nr:beta-lactamase-like protein [Penicillium atrosanguineum]KAJ5293541.1 beta-lactamase-like protein [Penicillium atrosanguineum]